MLEHLAPRVSAFLQHHLSPFLNHHRPCLFPTERASGSGRVRRRYRQQYVATPYERFRRLPDDREALSASGLDAAKELRRQLDALLRAVVIKVFIGRFLSSPVCLGYQGQPHLPS